MDRRTFIVSAGSTCLLSTRLTPARTGPPDPAPKLRSFDYAGVRILSGQFADQIQFARSFYLAMSNDDMLKGFRRAAGLPAPGRDMLGWCREDCSATFGQWLSGMARLSKATGDEPLRNKAIYLTEEWEKTLSANGDPRMTTYAWEKMSCGLIDLAMYGGYPRATEILERITIWALEHFDRSRSAATEADRDGRAPHGTLEWYTLSENSLRAYALTGKEIFRDFADLWLYPSYWNKFSDTARPKGVELLHSYSHVNTFCGAAMKYATTGEASYLAILRNAYDWIRGTQAYASGGFGPGEWSVPADGSLGRALELRLDTAEIPCGSWAGFKLSRYLMGFTGDARYGDWIETLLYNGIGAALPVQPDGRAFYYADYRVGMATKTFFWKEWPCCSGSFIQAVADYHNIIYFHDDAGLYVNLAIPSEVNWTYRNQGIRVTQTTGYPQTDTTSFHLELAIPAAFNLNIRIPAWCDDAVIRVNGKVEAVTCQPNHWATIHRLWRQGDTVEALFALKTRLVPVDGQHPNRVAVMYGPLLMAQDARFSFPIHGSASFLESHLVRKTEALELSLEGLPQPALDEGGQRTIDYGGQPIGTLRPMFSFKEREPYRCYFDLNAPRFL